MNTPPVLKWEYCKLQMQLAKALSFNKIQILLFLLGRKCSLWKKNKHYCRTNYQLSVSQLCSDHSFFLQNKSPCRYIKVRDLFLLLRKNIFDYRAWILIYVIGENLIWSVMFVFVCNYVQITSLSSLSTSLTMSKFWEYMVNNAFTSTHRVTLYRQNWSTCNRKVL